MQRRYPLAALAAIGLVASAGPVHAEPSAEPVPAPATTSDLAQPQAGTITLPTGDQVRLTADGSYFTEPAEGGSGTFHTTVEPDGDRLIVPVGALPRIADGEWSMEQFNIDALVRHHIADAGDPGATALLEAEAAPQGGGPALVEVDFTGLWSDGSAPDLTWLRWIDVDTGEFGDALFDGGTSTLEMAPGHLHMVLTMDEFETSSTIAGVLDLHIDADPEPILFDGADANRVGFALDRETVPQEREFTAFSYLPDTVEGVRGGLIADGDWTIAVAPTGWDTTGRDVGFSLRQEFVSPEGTEKPYSYSLYEQHHRGIPADPVFRVSDEKLARIEMDYDSLGVDAEMTPGEPRRPRAPCDVRVSPQRIRRPAFAAHRVLHRPSGPAVVPPRRPRGRLGGRARPAFQRRPGIGLGHRDRLEPGTGHRRIGPRRRRLLPAAPLPIGGGRQVDHGSADALQRFAR